jgi:hypothetical protein
MEGKSMKWVEIIKLRSTGKALESLNGLLSDLSHSRQPGLTEIRLYRHAEWETDWSLHLHWESQRPPANGSTLGIRLSQELGEIGLIDYSTWIEQSDFIS